MPISAMPEHLNSKEKIDAAFPDDSQYGDSWFGRLYRLYNKTTKTWFAFSYRCTERWARWRKYPKVLFAVRGSGHFRVEDLSGDMIQYVPSSYDIWINTAGSAYYLSRVQYYCRWHFSIQWPLMITLHFYPKAKDVPRYEPDQSPSKDVKGKVWFAYWNHFDADLIYWMFTSAYLGRNWK